MRGRGRVLAQGLPSPFNFLLLAYYQGRVWLRPVTALCCACGTGWGCAGWQLKSGFSEHALEVAAVGWYSCNERQQGSTNVRRAFGLFIPKGPQVSTICIHYGCIMHHFAAY